MNATRLTAHEQRVTDPTSPQQTAPLPHPTPAGQVGGDAEWLSPDAGAMLLALVAGAAGGTRGEVPVGCVIIDPQGHCLAEAGSRSDTAADPLGHAELVALRRGAERLGNHRLGGCAAAVTLAPCPMCAYALRLARVTPVTHATPREGPEAQGVAALGAVGIGSRPCGENSLAAGAATLLRQFFARQRRENL